MVGKPRRFFGPNQMRTNSEIRGTVMKTAGISTFDTTPNANQSKITSPSAYLKRSGDVLDGAIGLGSAHTLKIISNKLVIDSDLTLGSITKKSVVNVIPNSGSITDLENITGGIYDMELLLLVGTAGNTITIKHNFGGNGLILCPNDVDYTLDGDETVLLVQTTTPQPANAAVWRIVGDARAGGGSGISFPVQYPIDDQGSKSGVTVTHDLSATTAHDLKFTATGAVTIAFSNYPSSGTGQDWYVEIAQDSTGGHAITWPAEVVPTPVVSTTADTTSLISLHTHDGGATVRAILLLNSTVGGGGGSEVFTWSADHDANDNNLLNLDEAQFNANGGTTATEYAIAVNSGDSGLVFNVPSLKNWIFSQNNVIKWTMSDTTLTGANYVASNTVSISDSSTDPLANGVFTVNGNDVKVMSNSIVRNFSNLLENPLTTNLDVDNNSLLDINQVQITGSSGSTLRGFLSGSSGNFDISSNENSSSVRVFARSSGGTLFRVASFADEVTNLNSKLVFESTNSPDAGEETISSLTGDMFYNCLVSDSHFFQVDGTTQVEIDVDGIDIRSPGWLEMTEITAPSSLANHVRIYAEDNGAGKTRLMAQFGSGAAQQLAIQP